MVTVAFYKNALIEIFVLFVLPLVLAYKLTTTASRIDLKTSNLYALIHNNKLPWDWHKTHPEFCTRRLRQVFLVVSSFDTLPSKLTLCAYGNFSYFFNIVYPMSDKNRALGRFVNNHNDGELPHVSVTVIGKRLVTFCRCIV